MTFPIKYNGFICHCEAELQEAKEYMQGYNKRYYQEKKEEIRERFSKRYCERVRSEHTLCCIKYLFPPTVEEQKEHIRQLRKARLERKQQTHPSDSEN